MSVDRKRHRSSYGGTPPGERERKRRRPEPVHVENRLESLITRVGEKSTASLKNNLEALATVLEVDIPNFKDKILQILSTCITNLPEKTTIYSTLVGLLNEKNFDFGGEILELMVKSLEDMMEAQQFDRARLMVRSISDLLNCNFLVATSLISFLENFINIAAEPNIPQCAKELSLKRANELERLLSSIEDLISKRSKLHVKALHVWSTNDPHPQEESIDCLWEQIKKMKNDGWEERFIARPYVEFHAVLCKALPHPIPALKIPSHSEKISYPLPTVVFRMFDYTDSPEELPIPGAHAIERYLVEESIFGIIHSHYKDRKECASQLLNHAKGKLPMDYVITEVIFGGLFRLPQTLHIPLFYGSLIIELCKLQPNLLNGLHITLVILSASGHGKNEFIILKFHQFRIGLNMRQQIKALQKMYYHQYVIEKIPEILHPLTAPEPVAEFKYENSDAADELGYETVKKLIDAIKSKESNEKLIEIVEEIPTSAQSNFLLNSSHGTINNEESLASLRIELFTLTVLRAGVKSISHTYSALSKFHPVFKSLITSTNGQLQCLFSIKEFWNKKPQAIGIVIDKLIRLQVINCSTVINWIFSKEMSQEFMRCYVWQILHSTLKKMIKHKNKASKDLKDAKEKLSRLIEKAKRHDDSSSESDEDSEKGSLNQEISNKESDVEKLREKVEKAEIEQKELFLILFQRFIMVLTDHTVQCEQQQTSKLTSWFRFTLQRLQEIFLTYHDEIQQYEDTLESLLFTTDLEAYIIQVFKRFKSLRS
eukprot:gene9859-10869_t